MVTFSPSSKIWRFSSRVPKRFSMLGTISILFFIKTAASFELLACSETLLYEATWPQRPSAHTRPRLLVSRTKQFSGIEQRGCWPTTAWRHYHSRREYPPYGLKSTSLVGTSGR